MVLAGCGQAAVCAIPDGAGCDDCIDGEYSCSYEDVTLTGPACDACQLEWDMVEAVCAEQPTLSYETIVAGTSCERLGDWTGE